VMSFDRQRLLIVRGYVLVLAIFLVSSCGKPEPEPERKEIVSFVTETDQGAWKSVEHATDVIYLDFWASWCVPCRESFPWMNDMLARYGDQGLKVVGVSLDHERGLARQFADELDAKFIIGFDDVGKLADQFNVKGLPSSVLIGRNGELLGMHTGFNSDLAGEFEESIRGALDL